MKKISFVLGLLFVAVMLVGWRALPQGTRLMSIAAFDHQSFALFAGSSAPELTINNQTGQSFYITLTGPQSYLFQVLPGKAKFEIAQGDYTYSFYACGAQQTDTLKVKKSGATLNLSCGKGNDKSGKTPVLTIDNKTGASFYITLTGPKSYTFNVPAGKSTYQMEQGSYEASYYACSEQRTDTVKIKKKGGNLKIDCAKAKSGKELAITMNNLTGGTMYMTLTGPASYNLTLPEGKLKIFVLKGTYDYTVSGICGYDSGTVNLMKKGVWTWWCE